MAQMDFEVSGLWLSSGDAPQKLLPPMAAVNAARGRVIPGEVWLQLKQVTSESLIQ